MVEFSCTVSACVRTWLGLSFLRVMFFFFIPPIPSAVCVDELQVVANNGRVHS